MKKKLKQIAIMAINGILIGAVLQIFFLSLVMASNLGAQSIQSVRDVAIYGEYKNVSIQECFSAIEKNTNYTFNYNENDLNNTVRINFKSKNKSVSDFLLEISKKGQLKFRQVNNTINVLQLDESDKNKPFVEVIIEGITVTGRVISTEDNEGIPGVNVIVKGTSQGTVTDVEGNYKLEVPGEESVLVFSSVGYTPEEIVIGNQTIIDISMVPDITSLEEIVVIGYGTMRKADLTGSVSSVSSKQIDEVPVITLDRALQGRAAGVNVQQQSNTPGGDVKVRIRGINSINGNNSPLYVIDEIIGANINTVDPNDIASIDILKDAAAASIYGARGANGVIIVTTKKGKTGKPVATFDMYYGIDKPADLFDMMNAEQYMEYVNDADIRNNTGNVVYPNIDQVVNQIGEGTAWQDEMFKNGSNQKYYFSLNGGSENISYMASAGYQNWQGLVPNSNWNRFTTRLNLDIQATKSLSFGTNISYVNTKRDIFEEESRKGFPNWVGPVSYTVSNPSLLMPRDENDNLIPLMNNEFAAIGTETYNNGIYQAENEKRKNLDYYIQMTFYGKWKIIDPLVFRVSMGIQPTLGESLLFNPYDVPNEFQEQFRSASKSSSRSNRWLVEPTLTYTNMFKDVHSLTAMIGSSTQKTTWSNTSASSSDFPFDFYEWNSLQSGLPEENSVGSSLAEEQYQGFYGRINYVYDERYLIQVNGRYDGNSKFAPGNQWAFFPSASVGWRISEESFLESSGAIDNLKLRASYGSIGSPAIAPYSTIPQLAGNNWDRYVFGDQQVNSYVARLTNPNLKWETTTQLDIGVDVGFFKGRLNITMDYYNKITEDLILNQNVTIVNNAWRDHDPAITRNIGSMRNSGFEFNADFYTDLGDNFTWDVNLNFAYQTNEVIDMNFVEGQTFLDLGNNLIRNYHRLEEGQPFGNYVGYKSAGIFQTQEEINSSNQPSAKPGDIIYVDVNGDNTINESDKSVVGNAYPDFYGGFTNTFTFKGFELSFMFYGVFGQELFNMGAQRYKYGLSEVEWNKFSEVALDRWTGPGTSNDIPRAGYSLINGTDGPNGTIDIVTENASFVKLRDLSIAYNFPRKILSKIGMESLRVYLKGQNLLLFTNYSGYDPEQSNLRTSEVMLPLETALYPFVRTYFFGLNFTF